MKLYKFSLVSLFLLNAILLSCGGSGGGSSIAPDITAPVWNAGYPKAIDLDDRIYVKASLNESGHVYCVIRRDGDPAPSVQDIADGMGEFAVDAEANADTVTTLVFKDLSYLNAFDLYCVGVDDSNNMQKSAVKIDILTSARNTVFVSQTDGNDINMGSISYPKKTIASAIAYAKANWPFSMSRKICVSQGTYEESVELTEGISLLGGYDPSDWSERDIDDRTNSEYATIISGDAGENYAVSIHGTNSSSGDWVVEGLTIASNSSTDSQSLWCYADSLVKIRYNTINGGNGSAESIGIYLNNNASTEISNNVITGGNSLTGYSNGIYIESDRKQIVADNNIDGGGTGEESRGIIILKPVDYDTIISGNIINGGSGASSWGISISNNTDNSFSSPLIYGNRICAGTGESYRTGILLSGTGDTRSITPIICNNVIATGNASGNDAYSITLGPIDGTAYLYNNTLILENVSHAGIILGGDTGRESIVSLINNIFSGPGCAIVETNSFSICSVLKNNDLFCSHYFDSNGADVIDSIDDLNGLRTDFEGNISIDALLDSTQNFTGSSPVFVTEGGLDLSAYPYFQENASGQKIDMAGKVRIVPWSIGAFEKE